MKRIAVIMEKTPTGFSAYAEKYPAFTTGATVAELIANMVKSITVYFEETGEAKVVTPYPPGQVHLS